MYRPPCESLSLSVDVAAAMDMDEEERCHKRRRIKDWADVWPVPPAAHSPVAIVGDGSLRPSDRAGGIALSSAVIRRHSLCSDESITATGLVNQPTVTFANDAPARDAARLTTSPVVNRLPVRHIEPIR